jgi:hypothetical protein
MGSDYRNLGAGGMKLAGEGVHERDLHEQQGAADIKSHPNGLRNGRPYDRTGRHLVLQRQYIKLMAKRRYRVGDSVDLRGMAQSMMQFTS